jgi:TonB family protein
MTASFALHGFLLAGIMTIELPAPDVPIITEITLIEPGDLAAASAPKPSAAPPAVIGKSTVSGLANASPENVQFLRSMPKGEVSPGSEVPTALSDRLEARLATMQRSGSRPADAATALTPVSLVGTRAATVPGPGGSGSAPLKLVREGVGGVSPQELSRGGTPGAPATLAPAALAPTASAANAPAKPGEATAQRTVAGASLLGPVADRPVLFHSLPHYPEWAKREAVESSVTLYFVVRPNGSVRENVMVQRTAGFGDFDENARTALRAWRFEPLKGGRTGDQWGTITFHFRLREAG